MGRLVKSINAVFDIKNGEIFPNYLFQIYTVLNELPNQDLRNFFFLKKRVGTTGCYLASRFSHFEKVLANCVFVAFA